MKYFWVYLSSLSTLLLLDMVWLGLVATSVYQQGMGSLMAVSPHWVAAGLFYLLYPVGIVIFGVAPGEKRSLVKAAGRGALFGFFAYATYDLTNLATLRDWPASLSILDMAWGTALSAASAAAGRWCWLHLDKSPRF
ncbi:MAG: DUF2177 family protein [Polaromonas sp.]